MKRTAHPPLSRTGHEALASYEDWLREREDLAPVSIRNYLSDLRHFIAWYETERETQVHECFTPQGITTPALTRYRTYLQTVGRQKPASVNRSLISLKRYFGWASQQHVIPYDLSLAVKLVGQEESTPRHLDDQEEQALVAAATKAGNLRDRVLIVLLLHTGLRARELCRLRCDQVKLGKRSGFLEIIGKRNKHREVPLNATARKMLEEYLPTLARDTVYFFPSNKTNKALSERALGYIVKKYARAQNSLMSVLTICGTVSDTGWQSPSRSIDWHKSWDMTHWTPPSSTSRERSMICNKRSKRSRGHN